VWRSIRSIPSLVTLALLSVTPIVAQEAVPRLELEPCEIGGIAEAQCGTLTVYEDRAARSGRTLDLYVVVVPATDPDPEPDPIYVLTGGPGSAATEAAPTARTPLRARRSYVFMDQRGTGRSNGLYCLVGDDAPVDAFLGEIFDPERIARCREELADRADLTLYTTPIAMDDLDDLREALGHEKINLWGTSYGTRAALVYLRRHEEHVRSAVLNASMSLRQTMPMEMAADAETAIRNVIADCLASEPCAARYPDLEEDYRVAVEGASGPVEVTLEDPRTEQDVQATMQPAGFAEALRAMMYDPEATRDIPRFLHRAAREGNYDGFAQFGARRAWAIARLAAGGLYLSVTCAEDIPFANEPGEYETGQGTFLTDRRARSHFNACRLWPQGSVPEDFHDQVVSDVPVLILNGEHDPVTPPRWGREAAQYLSRSIHVVVPHGGHAWSGLERSACVFPIRAAFIENPTADELDMSCLDRIRRRPFRE
jgi:pimeloyl-ACP methyl ester carboxylesterase